MKKISLAGRLKAAAVGLAVAVTAFAAPVSTTTQKAEAAVNINYAKALQYSLYLYDANMCGTQVGEKSLLKWRDDCHTYDKAVSTPYGTMDLSGGFHDAGDHVKFGLPGAYSASMLGWSYLEFKDAFTKTGQAGHLKTITDYFCDYYRRCTVMEGSNVKAFCYQVGDGDVDHGSWKSPEKDTMNRPAFFATSSNPCTDVVAETAAALALNYANFGNPDDLTYAKALYNFAKTNNKSGHQEQSYYTGDTWLDDLAMAAICLYKATNDGSYKSDCGSWIQQSNYQYTTTWPLCWNSVWPAVNSLYGQEWSRVSSHMDGLKSKATSEGYYAQDNWGSARYNTATQMEGLIYDKHNGSSSYTSWAKGQMEYLFGNNKNGQCYMVGYDSSSVKYPHHRAASGYDNFPSENRGKPYANVLVGALVGGPDNGGGYIDQPDEYKYTEVALDYNAGFVGALAGLYEKYGAGQSVDSNVPGARSSSSDPIVTDKPVDPIVTTTTTTTVTTQKPDYPIITTTTQNGTDPQPISGNEKTVTVNKKVDYSNNKTLDVPLSQLIPSGAKAQKFIVKVSSNGDLSNMSVGGGVAVNGGWETLNGPSINSSGSSATITYDVTSVADKLDMNGNFQFGYWWGTSNEINVDSVTCVFSGGSVVTQPIVTTAATTTTTTTTTTITTTATTTSTTSVITVQPVATTLTSHIDYPITQAKYGDVYNRTARCNDTHLTHRLSDNPSQIRRC